MPGRCASRTGCCRSVSDCRRLAERDTGVGTAHCAAYSRVCDRPRSSLYGHQDRWNTMLAAIVIMIIGKIKPLIERALSQLAVKGLEDELYSARPASYIATMDQVVYNSVEFFPSSRRFASD